MNIHTYADGCGVWHAVVPAVGSLKTQRESARRAIRSELMQRQGDQRIRIRFQVTPGVETRNGVEVRVWKEM